MTDPFKSPFLTVKDLSKYLQIHEMTVYRMLKRGAVPGAFRLGGYWRINKDVMEREFLGNTSA